MTNPIIIDDDDNTIVKINYTNVKGCSNKNPIIID